MERCSISLIIKECKSKPQWGVTSHLLELLSSKSLPITNAREDVEKREPSYTVGGNINCAAIMENYMEIPPKTKNITTIWPSNSTPGHTCGKNEITNLKRNRHPHVHNSSVYNNIMEAKIIPISRWIDEDGAYIYTIKYYSAIKRMKFCPLQQCGGTWRILCLMKCQKKTNTIWHHLYTESKTYYKWMYMQNRMRQTYIENKLVVTKGDRKGERGMVLGCKLLCIK